MDSLFSWSQRNQNSYLFLPNNTDTSCLHNMDTVSYMYTLHVHLTCKCPFSRGLTEVQDSTLSKLALELRYSILWKCGSLMVGLPDSGLSCPGLSPGWGHCVLGQGTNLSQCLSPPRCING